MKPALSNPTRRTRDPGIDVRAGTVRQARTEAGLSMAGLAGTDLSRGAIYHLEQGRSRPSMKTLELIAAKTGKPLSFFLDVTSPAASARLPIRLVTEASELERKCLAGRYDEAVAQGKELLNDVKEPRSEARVRLWVGVASIHLHHLDEASEQVERAAALFKSVLDPWAAAECLSWRAQAAAMARDDDAQALAEQARRDAEALDPVALPARLRAMLVLGQMHSSSENWDAAHEAYETAVELASILGNPARMAEWYEQLSAAHHQLGDFTSGIEWSWRAITLREMLEQARLIVDAHVGLGRSLLAHEDVTGAIRQLLAGLEEAKRLGQERSQAEALLALADASLLTGAVEQAADYAGRTLGLAEAVDDESIIARSHVILGRVAAWRGNADATDREFAAALELLAREGAVDRLVDTRTVYAEILESRGETAGALAQWKLAGAEWRPSLSRQSAATGPRRQ